jgi:hypothetical protein
MPRRVTASRGDTLCGLAVAHGFPNCDPLRAEPANRAVRDRPLRGGDRVTIPDRDPGERGGLGAEVRHSFRRIGAAMARIRFTHGSRHLPCADDPDMDSLRISNYVTMRGGVPETSPFPNHTTSAFNAAADADVDAFKVEIFDPDATAATLDVEIESLRPVYAADGSIERHEPFTDADRAARSLRVTCRRTATDPQRYRSCYLRLVVDEEDKSARREQTLLISDLADGAAGAEDKLEILDQNVRATYEIPTCNAAPRCRSTVEVSVGANRLRFRLQVHVQRDAPGAAALVDGITTQEVRRHLKKWVRRTYAQCDMSFRLTGPEIDEVDPLRNLISVFNPGRQLARGGAAVRVRVNTAPTPTTIAHNTTAGETPLDIAQALAAQISALPDFSATVHENPRALTNAQSADIVVTRSDGNEVVLDQARSSDSRARVEIGRVNPRVSTTASFDYSMVGARDHRVLIRNHAKDAASVHVFVIRRFRPSDGAVGFAYSRDVLQPTAMRATTPVVGTCFVEARTLSSADRRVHTTDHEIGHILCDMIHFSGRHPELMTDEPVDLRNSVLASKRMTDRVLSYRHPVAAAAGGGVRNAPAPVNPTDAARTRENPAFIEPWPR